MIVFDLECRKAGHRFEGWFGSSDDYEQQFATGLLACPTCGSADVGKAVMAPNVGRKGNQLPALPPSATAVTVSEATVANAAAPAPAGPALPPEAAALFQALARAQAAALKSSRWVGKGFVDQARAMHYGEREHEMIHGQATPDEARELLEEGVEVAPILFPVAPPEQTN